MVFMPGASSNVRAFDAVTGALRWRSVDLGDSGLSGIVTGLAAMAVAAGLVVVPVESPPEVVALNASTGAVVWRRPLARLGWYSSITVAGDRVFVGLDDPGRVVALQLQTGSLLWEAACCGRQPVGPPTVSGGLLVVPGTSTTGAGMFTVLDASTGARRWRRLLEGDIFPVTAVRDRVVYAGMTQGVVALDLLTGNTIWQNTTDTPLSFGPLSVTRDLVLAPANDGEALVALDRRNGTLQWRNDIPSQSRARLQGLAVFGALVWSTSRQYDEDGNPTGITVDAYRLGTGARVFFRGIRQSGGDAAASSPPIVIDGRVCVNTRLESGSVMELTCLALP
jgi:outer membrane protein assembly factor BamB